jgi:hypothetical protein
MSNADLKLWNAYVLHHHCFHSFAASEPAIKARTPADTMHRSLYPDLVITPQTPNMFYLPHSSFETCITYETASFGPTY